MKRLLLTLALLPALLTVTTGCGLFSKDSEEEKAAKQRENMLKQVEKYREERNKEDRSTSYMR